MPGDKHLLGKCFRLYILPFNIFVWGSLEQVILQLKSESINCLSKCFLKVLLFNIYLFFKSHHPCHDIYVPHIFSVHIPVVNTSGTSRPLSSQKFFFFLNLWTPIFAPWRLYHFYLKCLLITGARFSVQYFVFDRHMEFSW